MNFHCTGAGDIRGPSESIGISSWWRWSRRTRKQVNHQQCSRTIAIKAWGAHSTRLYRHPFIFCPPCPHSVCPLAIATTATVGREEDGNQTNGIRMTVLPCTECPAQCGCVLCGQFTNGAVAVLSIPRWPANDSRGQRLTRTGMEREWTNPYPIRINPK